jgi:hypothetical protein
VTQQGTTASYPTRENASAGRPSNSLHFAVGEISGKLDQLLVTLLPQLTDHETRISTVEVRQARMLGGGAVIVFIITALEAVPYVWNHITR